MSTTTDSREGRARAAASRSEPGGRAQRGVGAARAAGPLADDLPVEVRERGNSISISPSDRRADT